MINDLTLLEGAPELPEGMYWLLEHDTFVDRYVLFLKRPRRFWLGAEVTSVLIRDEDFVSEETEEYLVSRMNTCLDILESRREGLSRSAKIAKFEGRHPR